MPGFERKAKIVENADENYNSVSFINTLDKATASGTISRDSNIDSVDLSFNAVRM